MDKKTPKSKQLKSAPKAGRVSMTDLVGVTKPAPAAQKPKAKAPQPTTQGAAREVRPDDKVINVSLSLRESEYTELQDIADSNHATRGSLMTALMRHALKEYREGRVALEVKGVRFVSP